MTELQRYLAEEVAEDHSDGIITRREAIRRLGLLGVSGAAATALLSAPASRAVAAPGRGGGEGNRARGLASEDAWAPVATTPITFAGPNGTLMGAWAPADGRVKGSVLVIHENRGLNDHIRNVAGRFAASGWSALALDLLSEEGGTASFPDEAAVSAALAQIAPTRFDTDMKAAVSELRRRVPRKPVNAIGFCFGGGMVWRLLAAGERRLAAAAPFYGPFPEGGDLSGARAAVLAVYGGLDTRVNASIPTARAALEAARLKHQILTFTEANHAFFNDTGARFNAPAAEEAWARVTNWFGRRHKR
jgi:carboxymethylenebutenolidase